jgi:hypothetical protein
LSSETFVTIHVQRLLWTFDDTGQAVAKGSCVRETV